MEFSTAKKPLDSSVSQASPRAVVIGAGIGGIATAALLARDGFVVTVLEKNEGPGGRAGVFLAKGFRFDMGPSWYLMQDVFEQFFSLFGTKPSDFYTLKRLDPNYTIYFSKTDKVVIKKDLAANIKTFEKLQPGAGTTLQTYLDRSKWQYQMAMNRFIYKDYRSLLDFADWKLLINGAKLRIFQPIGEYIDSFFHNQQIQKILSYTMVFLGGAPSNTPAIYALMSHIDFNMGVWYPVGGIFEVIKALVQLAERYGVKFIYHQPATQIITKNGVAIGVKTTQAFYPADVVISNADYPFTEQQLLAKQDQTYPASYWQQRTLAPSAYILYLGINKKLKNLSHHTLFLGENWTEHFEAIFDKPSWPAAPSYYVCTPSITDPSVAPKGKENIFVLVPVAPGLKDTDQLREKYYQQILAHLENTTGQSIREDVIFKRIFTQRDFIDRYHSYQGTALGLAHTIWQTALFRPKNQSQKIKNLFYTGQYTIPGIGMPMCLISAEIVAKKVRQQFKSPTLKRFTQLFQKSSRTYFLSSLLFPAQLRDEVKTLYAYVRTADDFVDQTPQDKKGFQHFVKTTRQIFLRKGGTDTNDPILQRFAELSRRFEIPYLWVDSFLAAMAADLQLHRYQNYQQLQKYMYGSAEVVGLMMAKLMKLPTASYPAAQKLAQAMQLTNFLRDISEDAQLGRVYIPQQDLKKFGLARDWEKYHQQHKLKHWLQQSPPAAARFHQLMQFEVDRAEGLYQQAAEGYHFLPWRARLAVQTAANLYGSTLQQIKLDPMQVWERKIKPSMCEVFVTVIETVYEVAAASIVRKIAVVTHFSILKLSRPRFWMYLAGPYLIGAAAGSAVTHQRFFEQPAFLFAFFFFLIPANILLYGINDIADQAGDKLNYKKEAREYRFQVGDQRLVLSCIFIAICLSGVLLRVFPVVAWPWLGVFMILAIGYSLPPLRFKTIPFFDSISNVLYIIPGLIGYLVWSGGQYPPVLAMIGAASWAIAMHAFSAIPDIIPDKKAGFTTIATVLGAQNTLAVCGVLWSVTLMTSVLAFGPIGAVTLFYPLLSFLLLRENNTQLVATLYWQFPWLTTTLGLVSFILIMVTSFS